MRVSFFLVLLLANSCGTPGVDRPGDHGSNYTGSSANGSGANDKRPALCSDIKDDHEKKCKPTSAKEGECIVFNYQNNLSCISEGKKREYLADKKCEGILGEQQCQGAIVGPLDNPQVCRKEHNGCKNAPSYYNYASECRGRDIINIQTAIGNMCNGVPSDKCEGDEATFSVFPTTKLALCKTGNTKGSKCVQNQEIINNGSAKKLVDDFCLYLVSQDKREYFANKTKSGLILGYKKETCSKQVFSASKRIMKTDGERGTSALLTDICEPAPSN